VNHDDLVRALIHYVEAGKLEARVVQPALRTLRGGGTAIAASGELLDAVRALGNPDLRDLADHLRESRRQDAIAVQRLKSRGEAIPTLLRETLRDLPLDLPIGWGPRDNAYTRVQAALRLIADRFFFLPHQSKAPVLAKALEDRYQAAVDGAFQNSAVWGQSTLQDLLTEASKPTASNPDPGPALAALRELIERRRSIAFEPIDRALSRPDEPLAAGIDEDLFLERAAQRLAQTAIPKDRRALLDRLCAWPNDRVAPVLAALDLDDADAERVMLLLSLRFGHSELVAWEAWRRWLKSQVGMKALAGEGSRLIVRRRPLAMLYLWYSRQPDRDSEALATLERRVAATLEPVTMDAFVDRWARSIPTEEWRALTGEDIPEVKEVAKPKPVPAPAPAPRPAPPPVEVKPVVVVPKPPPKPSVWDVHLKPFFLDNWYMVAGVMMVLVGSSLLAYYTWDKAPIVRYTVMPALLGAFTMTLAWMGGWIERKDQEFKATGAVLRAAAIGLLPVNFMAIALLANGDDQTVAHKAIYVPLMGAVYLSVFGWGLRRWCAGVHERIGTMLGGTLLFLNSLVVVAPLARAISGVDDARLLPIVGTGFYLGFIAMAAAVLRFSRSILTVELSKDKRVVWFFGATLAVTFVQVFAWVHGYLKHLPHVYTYAPMMVLTGGLVLVLERRTLELRGEAEKHGAESFLGFAFILLGVLMGIGEPILRIATFALAGGVWIGCTIGRRAPLHAWIGLTLATLGGASIGLLPGFPKPWMPSLGIALALGLGFVGLVARRSDVLAKASAGMQAAVLLFTAIVTVISQHSSSGSPMIAAAHLAAVSALFGFRAWRDQKIRWAQTAMVILALALPYVVGFDVEHEHYHSTSLVLGLALLGLAWAGAGFVVQSPVYRGARSTVLWVYGALAVTCMAAWATIDHASTLDYLWVDAAGPLLMIGMLVVAAWLSRSLVPSGMAMLIGLILAPHLKERMQIAFPQLAWGSGLGSAVGALAMILLAFRLRSLESLKSLGAGDKYLGENPYPLELRNCTLFTWPLLTSAVFLTIKVEAWNFFVGFDRAFKLPTAIALIVTGCTWLLFAVYHRRRPLSVVASYVGLLWGALGSALTYVMSVPSSEPEPTFLWPGLFLQALFFLFRFGVEKREDWAARLLTQPARRLLRIYSLLLSVGVIAAYVLGTKPEGMMALLTSFVTLQLAWHGLASRHYKYGFQLYLVNWAVLAAVASSANFWGHLHSLTLPTLILAIGVQALQVALEFRRPAYDFLKPLMVPFQGLATFITGFVGFIILFSASTGQRLSIVECGACVVSLALSARAMKAGPLALLAVLVGYVMLHVPGELSNLRVGWESLLTPWHLSCLALVLAVLADAGMRIHARTPAVLVGPFRPAWSRGAVLPWIQIPAILLPFVSAVYQIAGAEYRDAAVQAWGPYLGAASLALVAFSTGRRPLYHAAGALLSLGNIQLIRSLPGPWLLAHGLSEVHLVVLGLGFTLLQGSAIRLLLRKDEATRLINQSSLVGAGLILLLLSANYLVHPDLAAIRSTRFAISGAMSLLAGGYFRRAARAPAPGEAAFGVYAEGFYHFGVTMAFWCGALMIPALRTPLTALIALGLPVAYFYARAEFGFRRSTETFERYRASAATLGFVVLGLYTLHSIVRMVIFPGTSTDTGYYHANAPVIFVLGLILLRLQALGGTSWLSFYGGLAVMGSSYFALTALPGLSPFQHPGASAWAALALAHFYTVASHQRSPLRTAIQRLAGLDANQWQNLRRPWGVCLLVAAHGLVLLGCLDHGSSLRAALMVAPLILGAASVLVHQGIARQSRLYFILAQIEVVLALHADFLVPSYLPQVHVLWALLAVWAGLIALQPWISRVAPGWKADAHVAILAALAAAHIAWHGPSSPAGLWAFAAASVLLALTPTASRAPEQIGERLAAALLPWAPAWLVWFSQARTVEAALTPWPALVTIATLFATGLGASFLQKGGAELYLKNARLRPRLYDQTVSWLGAHGNAIHSILLWTTVAATALVQGMHWGRPFEAREVVVLELLYAAFAVASFFEGQARKAMAPFFLLEVCVLGSFLVARQQFALTRYGWAYEYDIIASLAAFFGFVGAKQLLDRQPRELLVPLKSSLLALPAFTVAWMLIHHLNTNLELIVIGLHSAAFAYLGKDDRESPYHLIAVGGFVGFVLLLFGSTLHLAMVYAYVIPVGVGVLVLLQLFKERVEPQARNGVRTVVLVSMIGSAGWSALLDANVPLLHNLAVIVLCLGAMGLGGFLRIRLYAAIGFAALMLDLVVIFVKAVALLERTARMTIVGSSVLAVGTTLVFGAIYYKTHRQEIEERMGRWRTRLSGWE
jgi:hypothetical protein